MKTFCDEERALLAAIHADPREDTPRLVYADWLDEHDCSDLAEMIRLGIEAAKTRTPPQCVPRIRELGRRLLRKYVSPLPNRMRGAGWERGLPLIGLTVDVREVNYRQILDGTRGLYVLVLGIRHETTAGLRAMLSHPALAQTLRLWIKPSSRFTPEDVRVIAEWPRLRLLEQLSFTERPVSPTVTDAVLSVLAPIITVGWWEHGFRTAIDSDRPSTWPTRYAQSATRKG